MHINVDIDPDEVLDDMSLDEIMDYLNSRFSTDAILRELDIETPISESPINSYWHGDLNIKAFLKELGSKETKKIITEIEEEF